MSVRPSVEEYRRCAAEGLTLKAAAASLGLTCGAVRRRAKRLGICFAMSDVVRAQRRMDDFYGKSCAAGLAVGDMVRVLQVNRNTVLKRARRLGLTFRGSVPRRGNWPGAGDYLTCYRDGLTTGEAGHRLGVSRETVRKWGYKLGVVFNRSSGRRAARRCEAGQCEHFEECQQRGSTGGTMLCEKDIVVVGQSEELLWSRNGGDDVMSEYYSG